MDFMLDEQQQAVADLARQIFTDRVDHARLKEVEAGSEWFDREVWAQLGEAGLIGIALPESHGGGGLDLVALGLVLEAQGAAVAPLPLLGTGIGGLAVAELGTDDQRDRLLPGVADGSLVVGLALEEYLNDELLHPTTSASHGADGWLLNGTKVLVEHAPQSHWLIASAQTASGTTGLFLVEPTTAGVQLVVGTSTRKQPVYEVTFAGAAAEPLGEGEPDGHELRWLVERAWAAQCATQLGVTETALRLAAEYTTTREQFGRPIATFQAVTQRLADAYINVEGIRLTAYQALWLLAQGHDATEAVAIAKYWSATPAQLVAHATQHVHGGIGVDSDYPLHRYTLWNKHLEHTLGAGTRQLRTLGALIAAG